MSRKLRDGVVSWGVEHDPGGSGKINGLSGIGATNAVAVGDGIGVGRALKYDGTSWTPLPTPPGALYAVWCRASSTSTA